MKAVLLASSLLALPVSSALARGDGFGAALGGSLVGSALGSIIGNSVSQPPPPPPPPTYYYRPAPVYVLPAPMPMPRPLAPVVARAPAYAAPVPPDVGSASYQQGSTDRDAWDSWFSKLDGQTKAGAAFWADQRAQQRPQQCRVHASLGNDWIDGCSSAQRRLAASDARRKTDAQYRNGWDKLVPEIRAASAPAPAPAQPPAVTALPIPISAPAPAAPDVKETSLGDVFNADMLNVEVPYFERTVGPAKRVTKLAPGKTVRTYVVEGCNVKAHVDGTSIYAFAMDLTPGCNVNLKPFLADFASTKNLTLGKFVRAEGDGMFHATCLTTCGRNDDPMASYHWQGGRATSNLEVELLFPVKDGNSDDAAVRLAKAVTDKDGPTVVSSAAFNCDPKYSAAALDAYKDALVSEIVVGFGIEDEAGIYKASCQKTN